MRRAQLRRGSLAGRFLPGMGRRTMAGCAVLLTVGLTAAGCGANNRSHVGDTPVDGGTVTYALPANVTPNYIFPFTPAADFTIVNLDNLQYLLWRPLYWWGNNGLPYLNDKLSLAFEPTYHGQVVTIKLKHHIRWTDGSVVTAKNVMFWMNLMKSLAPSGDYGGYIPGGIPDNVTHVHAVNDFEVQMTIKGKYSPAWFTDNELSQLTPLPLSWDRTSSGATSDCADHISDCPAVFNYLNSLATDKKTWATEPLWKDVDGPWQLTSYTQGVLGFSWNSKYALPVPKHHITRFIEQPYTTEEAEFNVLQAGGAHPLDVGYLPTVDAPVPPPGAQIGTNPVPGYRMQPLYTWGLSYIPYNFNAADPQVDVFKQLYFRQAFQYLVNQAAIVQGALHGYGKVETGPVGDAPPTKYLSPTARKGDPFPFNLGKAKSLLTENGWAINANGVTTCENPGSGKGECGAGIKDHQALNFRMLVATGNAWVDAAVLQLKSNASLVGIRISVTNESFDQVITTVENQCGNPPKHPVPCPWELADWGEGWSYVPDYLPTGDELFKTLSGGNIGQYSNTKNNDLIDKTLQTSSLKAMYAWEDYLTQQLPVVLQPTAPAALIESIDNLHIGPQSPTLAITPEDWYFTR